jgi:hypothetical protein
MKVSLIYISGIGVSNFSSVFWDKAGIMLVDYLGKGPTITAKNCVALLDKLKQQLVSKHQGKFSKGILILQGNVFLTRLTLHTRN